MPRTRTYGLDIDTIRYAQRVKSGSGATILPEPLKQINKFVIGVKKLGLWNSMVCWPMRGIHNAGTGSTVYSLGGLGTYNGTMVNSPTWNFNGVNFNLIASCISTSLTQGGTDDINLFSVAECTAYVGGEPHAIAATRGPAPNGSTEGFSASQNWYGSYANTVIWSGLGAIEATITKIENGSYNAFFHRMIVSSDSKTSGIAINLGSESTTTIARAYTAGLPLVIGNQRTSSTSSLRGTLPFLTYIKAATINRTTLYTLYKRTLGIGLNLP